MATTQEAPLMALGGLGRAGYQDIPGLGQVLRE